MTSNLDSPRDRIAGVLVGVACGDALGAGYEFGPPMAPQAVVDMIGGGPFGFEPGEWTDDTSMAIAIAEVLRTGLDLRARDAQDLIVQRWLDWSHTAKDIGNQTRAVLGATRRRPSAKAARIHAQAHHNRSGRSGGNGSLMRTAPVALGYLHDPGGLAEAARAISDLTHYDHDAGDGSARGTAGTHSSTTPNTRRRKTSFTTDGSSKHCKQHGLPLLTRRCRRTTRVQGHTRPRTCNARLRPPCAGDTTLTRLPPSPAAYSVPAGESRQFH